MLIGRSSDCFAIAEIGMDARGGELRRWHDPFQCAADAYDRQRFSP